MWEQLMKQIGEGDFKALARSISLVENEATGYDSFLLSLVPGRVPVIGITGPPGAGKSTLTDSLISQLLQDGKKVAVLCVDPSSPFNLGSLLGDRIRMSQWYNNPNVYIRSLASRGSLGGLHPHIIEITDILKSSVFDYILVETVGVGQSEVEVAGLADLTIVVLVPESGDEIQTMKAGLMEVADIFVINKADRPDADLFVKNLHSLLAPAFKQGRHHPPIIKTIATQHEGIETLHEAIREFLQTSKNKKMHYMLLAQKAWQLIQKRRMKDLRVAAIATEIEETLHKDGAFNLYSFVNKYQTP